MDYAKPVLDLLKDGPKRRQMLVNQLCSSVMTEKTLEKTLKELTAEGKILKNSKPPESRGGWETWYMLPGHRYLFDVDAGRIIRTIERLKPLLLRMPTVDEIAVETGITPSEAEHLTYKLAAQAGWYNPTPEIIYAARVKLGEVLVCAARIRQKLVAEDGTSEKFDYAEDTGIVEEAKRFLKNYPQFLPKLTPDGEVAKWNQEALRFLGDNYSSKDRNIPYFGVARPEHR